MSEHVTDHLSAYLDDELSAAARADVDAHLRVCASCADTLDELRRVVIASSRAAALDRPPANNLWAGIQDRIEGRAIRPTEAPIAFSVNTRVVSLADPAFAKTRRGVTLSFGQLAAAAAVLMAVSGATAWYVRGGSVAPVLSSSRIVQAEVEPAPAADSVSLANFADAEYESAVSDLERALAERRNDLNPRTVEILERNLKLIDAAIAEARHALEEDPANTYLNRHLVESRHRKLELLRRATSINEAD